MAAADSKLAKGLRDNEEQLLRLCQSDPVTLYQKMFQNSIFSDNEKYKTFNSLDHSRVDPRLQVRYLLRLVSRGSVKMRVCGRCS